MENKAKSLFKTGQQILRLFSNAADESTDIPVKVQVFIRGTNSNFEIIENLVALMNMHGAMSGKNLLKEVSTITKNVVFFLG